MIFTVQRGVNVGTQVSLNLVSKLVTIKNNAQILANNQSSSAPYRPPQWSQPAIVSIVLPSANATVNTSQTVSDDNSIVPGSIGSTTTAAAPTYYVFDGVIRTEHNLAYTKTQLPVQTGSVISDHIFVKPARIALEISMTDAFDSYTTGMWTGASSKSVNAYQTIVAIANNRVPFTLNTRLQTYTNVTIDDIRCGDDVKTMHGLRMEVIMSTTFIGQVIQQAFSARSQTSDSTPQGTIQADAASATQISNHSAEYTNLYQLPGAGLYTSGVI